MTTEQYANRTPSYICGMLQSGLKKTSSYLFHLAKLVDAPLVPLHAVLGQVQVRRVTIQLFLILRHLLDHL